RALHVVTPSLGHRRGEAVLADKFAHVPGAQRRLGVEGVEVAGAAFHEQEDAGCSSRNVVRRPWSQRAGWRGRGLVSSEKGIKGRRAEGGAETVQILAASQEHGQELQ